MKIDIEKSYKNYGPMVFRRCYFLLKDEDMAKDAMQDTFIKILTAQNKLTNTYLSSLFYKIATNICYNILNSKKSKEIKSDNYFLSQNASHEDNEKIFIIKDMLSQIFKNEKPSTQKMAHLHYIDKLTLAQTAEETGYSVSGVRKNLRKLKIKAKNISRA
ncbi:MAG: sigma-70 family RNA polymerase sigma factor [Spirochaetia bacterium]|nr:sigma-70 family RNA polymerase sigma factor [Spirochaetia bacterium]